MYHFMKKYILSVILTYSIIPAFAQNAHQIKVTLKPYKNAEVYLGYYYGKLKAIADSATLDANSTATFQGKEKLPGGIYFVVSPRKEILFEVLIDKEQHFAIWADTADLNNLRFIGSSDNNLFVAYTQFMAKKGKAINDAQYTLAKKTNKLDSNVVIQQIRDLNAEVQQYRGEIEKKYPQSFLTTLLIALKDPVVPPAPAQQAGTKTDSQFAYHYFKAHYWDGFSFTDDRMLRTPLFEPRLERYFKDLVSPDADSIIREVDMMLLQSRTNKEMFKFLLVHFTQKYVNPEFMGQDAVFVHIFEKYINTGQADFFTEKYRKYVNDRAYSLMANLIGQPAAELSMTDTLEKPQSLYAVESRFTVVCFWDPTCSHCMEIVPKVDSIYQAKWKQEGVKLFGVMVDGGKPAWLKFIHDHNLKDWIHVYQTKAQQDAETASNRPGYRQLYDVYQTPILYLLDKDKHIIAKKLSYQQFDEVIDLKLKSAKSN